MLFRMLEEEIYFVPVEEIRMENANRRRAIERTAYLLAERRGFAPGHELEDWLAAEHQRVTWERGCGADTYWL
jgi:hypothetical protein